MKFISYIEILINLIFSFLLGLILFSISIFFAVINFWILFIPPYKRHKISYYILVLPWTIIANNFIFFIRLKVLGKENINKEKTTLYICNHQSWADIPIFFSLTNAIGLSKAEVKFIPVIGLLTIYAGGIYFDRENKSSRMSIIKQVIDIFKKGYSLAYFPEGTRSKYGDLLEPNLNLLRVAYKNNIPVVTAAIEGTRDVIQRGRLYYRFFRKVVIKFNPQIEPKDYKNDNDFATACWEKVKETHNEIKKLYFNT